MKGDTWTFLLLLGLGSVGCTGGGGSSDTQKSASAVLSQAVTTANPAAATATPAAQDCSYLPRVFTQLLDLTNAARQQQGLGTLTLSFQLGQAAQAHAEDMATHNFFSHTGSNGSSIGQRVLAQQYVFSIVGENLAAGFTTPQATFDGWMNSPGHRQNILRPEFTEIGFGLFSDPSSTYEVYWSQNFGKPLADAAGSNPTLYVPTTCSIGPLPNPGKVAVAGVFETNSQVANTPSSVPEPGLGLGLGLAGLYLKSRKQ